VSQLDDVNAFILALKPATTANHVREVVGAITKEMGFHSFALVQHVKDFSRENAKFLAVSNFSESWVDYFLENRLHAFEPIYAASRRTTVGFRFDDLPNLIKLNDRQKEVRDASRKAGIIDGFCVPAHIPGEANGSCTFVVKNNKPLPERNLPMAQVVGNFAYEAARLLLRSGVRFVGPEARYRKSGEPEEPAPALPEVPKLTTRQLECVVLVGRGKSDWEIAKILGLHEQTVTDHLNEARRRFGLSRRGELVIHSLFHGQITFGDVMH
jgi:LuxR family quorum-sensing system transcriptional regulator CciR